MALETVISIGLPVVENMKIMKNRLQPKNLTGNEKRICIVTGTHGDELEGQYVCYEVIRTIKENSEKLKGIVDIYPALNPLGIDSISRGIPMFDLDMNRIFPGSPDGAFAEQSANAVVEDIKGANMCIDIHASNIFLTEIPQVRINVNTADTLVPYAKNLNVDLIWVHSNATVLESTLAYSLNSTGVPTLVVEMGVGMRITKSYCHQLIDGIFNLMVDMGIWEDTPKKVRKPILLQDGKVEFINAQDSGIFVPNIKHWSDVNKGDHIGDIVSPLLGEVLHKVLSPCNGKLFTIREYPVVYEGSLIARIISNDVQGGTKDE
ncbi:MAG: M14 family metallopeptidase [Oscillospiraceae bacterium]